MKNVFLNTSRTVCHRHIISGEVFGSTAIIITTSESFDSQTILDATIKCKNSASIARIEKWGANEKSDNGAMEEEAIRGPDKKISSCIFIENLRKEYALELRTTLQKDFPEAIIGVYGLLRERQSID
jgi:hypothetical protein